MKILGIESAALTASAAILVDGVITAEYSTNFKKTHSQTLLPMIEELFRMTGLTPQDMDAVAVSEGPGSFTGLRIGAATAKGIAFAINKPIIPVSTLAAMAYGLFDSASLICPIMDAKRDQVYTGSYVFKKGAFSCISEPDALSVEEQAEKAKKAASELGRPIIYLGDGVPVYEAKLRELVPGALFAPAHQRYERAANVCALAEELYTSGVSVSAEDFLPVYLRKSQAEREREEALRSQGLPVE